MKQFLLQRCDQYYPTETLSKEKNVTEIGEKTKQNMVKGACSE